MDTLDCLSGASFDELYVKDIEPELQLRETDRLQALGTFALIVFAGVLAVVVECLLASSSAQGRIVLPDARIWLATLLIAGFLGYLPLKGVAKAAKVDVLDALCKPLGVVYQAGGFEAPSFQTFLDLHLLPKPDGKTSRTISRASAPAGPSSFARRP